MENTKLEDELRKEADRFGVVAPLSRYKKGIRIEIPLSLTLWNTPLDELPISVRSKNGLLRAGARTIGHVAERIMSEQGLESIRNLGHRSISEIKTQILSIGYEQLNDREKDTFWRFIVQSNRSLPNSMNE